MAAAKQLLEDRGVDVPLDEIAKAAHVANATLYRHFPTRAELIVAVYADEVEELVGLGERLLSESDPAQALDAWLSAFVHHVATKRELALALPDGPHDARDSLFGRWHAAMEVAAGRLLARAQESCDVPDGLRVSDLLALASGVALTGLPQARLDAMLAIVREGYHSRGRPG